MAHQTLAVVGAAGGVGTTRLTLELGATLARDGRDVALLDAAYATQGLADYCPRTIDTDVTALVLEDAPLETGLRDLQEDDGLPGRLAACPARAPFARVARAKTPEAARRFESLVREAAMDFDHVLLDTPPVAANQAVAAATCADRVALVTEATQRGADALPRMADRLRDVGAPTDLEVVIRTAGTAPGDCADVAVPEADLPGPQDGPACAVPDDAFAPAVATVAETTLGVDLEIEFDEPGRLEQLLAGGR